MNAGLHVDRVMVDSGAAHSACPFDCENEHEIRETQRKIHFQTATGSRTRFRDSVTKNTYQVTDVEGPVAAVSSMDDLRYDGSVFTTRSMCFR